MQNNQTIDNLFKPSHTKRLLFFLFADTIIFCLSLFLGILFRFNFDVPETYLHRLSYWLFIVVFIKIFFLCISDIYKLNWRFVSINEFYKIVKALFLASIFLYFANAVLQKVYPFYSLPRSSVIIDFFVATLLVLPIPFSSWQNQILTH